ncbi:MAG TPA: hypothetical protein VG488_04810 [Candidatus Angelobacter sp.]|nr:hypothetical protein [Candidatus Angelobacter sp.]
MNYFHLQILSRDRILYESDVEPMAFQGFARSVASALVHRGMFKDHERYLMRMLPRWTGQPHLDKAGFADINTLAPPTGRFLDITFEGPVEPGPIKFFTLRWHSLDRLLVYQEDMTVASVFSTLINIAIGGLIKQKTVVDGEKLRIVVLARNEGLPTIDPELLLKAESSTLTIASQPLASETPRPARKDIKISITDRKPLITPSSKSPSAYPLVESVRQVTPGFLRVYMERPAWFRLKDAVKVSEEKQVEVAGALVGGVFVDEQGETFVEVSDILSAPEAQGHFYSVRIDTEVWRSLIEKVNVQYADRQKVMVGWYHTHLISKLNMTSGETPGGEMQITRQTFLSSDDVFVHDNFFPQPWHVALVADLSIGQDVFFYRRGQKLVDCGGFFLFGKNGQE